MDDVNLEDRDENGKIRLRSFLELWELAQEHVQCCALALNVLNLRAQLPTPRTFVPM
jgi:hypothetical protein